jgi:hypothetical protein
MLYGIIVDEAGFILSTYSGPYAVPDGYTEITEPLYLDIVPGASYIDGKIVQPGTQSGQQSPGV